MENWANVGIYRYSFELGDAKLPLSAAIIYQYSVPLGTAKQMLFIIY